MENKKKFFVDIEGVVVGCEILDIGQLMCDKNCGDKQKCVCAEEKKLVPQERILSMALLDQ